ncbi:GGDEF domain-containing protein [Thalassospira marina]|uniref:diguanylate cyclase n=1 Tax=Thalassospira marina TaxID=2048283 RepID=A0A2N3L012_9PROT|nr:GGDEF domain-containing protein [Thalassospira marina]AUG52207.1 GGDEF domain-containing protein [Thalassospira marina]PKR56128.1 GGDEF domain-containing protein [Thalassospira marina]
MTAATKIANPRDIAQNVMAMITDLNLQPTPQVYHVFYAYLADEISELSQIIRVLVRNTQDLNEETVYRLYHKYLGVGAVDKQLTAGVAGLQAAVERVEDAVDEVLRETEGFCSHLGDAASRFEDENITIEEVRGITTGLVDTTNHTRQRCVDFQGSLEQYHGEVRRVRNELELVRRDALTDTLTGIANRKMFDASLREAVTNSMETGSPLTLLMIDIDRFKHFNDTYGHRAGDGVLKEVARVLVNSTKGADTVARYGGEEFAIILPETTPENAEKLAEKLRQNVSSRRIRNKKTGKDFGQLTVSIGLSGLKLGENILEFIDRADEALYRAKQAGRNTCIRLD